MAPANFLRKNQEKSSFSPKTIELFAQKTKEWKDEKNVRERVIHTKRSFSKALPNEVSFSMKKNDTEVTFI